MQEGLAVEDAALAREEESEAVRPAQARHGVALARVVEADHVGDVGAEQVGEFSPELHTVHLYSKQRKLSYLEILKG